MKTEINGFTEQQVEINGFTEQQVEAAELAAAAAFLTSLQQWMNREDAKVTEGRINILREMQCLIENRIEMGSLGGQNGV